MKPLSKDDLYLIRTLMQSNIGVIEVCLGTELNNDQRELLGIALSSAGQVMRILESQSTLEFNTPPKSPSLQLPQAKIHHHTSAKHSAETVAASKPANTAPVYPMEILLAEDNPVNQRVVSRILSKRGHKVTVANNGREALDQLTTAHFDLVLMDIEMPQMDGLDAINYIREAEKESGDRVPIVALTALQTLAEEHPKVMNQIDGYLTKPLDSKKLFQVVESFTKDE